IYVSEFLEEHRDEYYELLKNVRKKGDWLSWIRFFLQGVKEQTESTLKKVGEIEALYKVLKERMPEINSIYANNLLDGLFIRPRFTTKSMKKEAHIANPQTMYSLIAKFLEVGIITDITPEKERNKIYAFPELIKII